MLQKMNIRFIIALLLLVIALPCLAQSTFHCVVKDAESKELLPAVLLQVKGTSLGTYTGTTGSATLENIPDGPQQLEFTFIGYDTLVKRFVFPLKDSSLQTIFLTPQGQDLEEVVVSSTRTNSRIEDLNTKVEVLGQEDMDEESTIVPGNITSILGDLSIITIQRTNVVNGNESIRMQGLDPRYTQIMRDGLPLYDGFSGSLGVLSIPPLDLKQVEIIKGSASTLYGGGAIGGLINFISKVPDDSAKTVITLNATTLNEYNLNAFSSKKNGKSGFTLFAGANYKTAKDINGDGFAEVAEQRNLILHPRFFYDWNEHQHLVVGLSTNYDQRSGGDIAAILYKADSAHPFLQHESTFRNTFDLNYTGRITEKQELNFKSAISNYQRGLDYSGFVFSADQLNSYSELSDLIRWKKHQLVVGLNLVTQNFNIVHSDTVLFHSYQYQTYGAFLQDDWQLASRWSMQLGMRVDHHSRFGDQVLPRLSFFYKPGNKCSIRLAAGTGYKVPDNFDFSSPSNSLLDAPKEVHAEHSYGINGDINYHTLLFGKLSLMLDEALYYTRINDPVYLRSNSIGQSYLENGSYNVNSYGTDTYMRLKLEELEVYLGYNHTESLKETDSTFSNVPFNPKDKFSTTIAYDTEKHWRMGVEASWTANQTVYDNRSVPNWWFMAVMVEYRFNKMSLVLNCENLLDVKQSNYEPIVTGTRQHPVFAPAWASMEGRLVNLSYKISF